MRLRTAFAALSIVALSACAPEAEAPPEPIEPAPAPSAPAAVPISYACESGQSVTVAYPDTATAQLSYQGQDYTLRTVQAASGARYVGADLEWATVNRDGQESATLSRLGPNDQVGVTVLERCSRPSPGPADADARLIQVPGPTGLTDPPCKGPQLRLSNEGGDAGAGNRVTIVGVQNIGSQRCSIHGYPTVSLQDGQGRVLSSIRTEQRPGGYSREGQSNILVTLSPQGKAFFDIAWSAIPNEGQGERACPSAARIRFVAPGDTSPVSLDQPFKPCGGRISVSPIRSEAEPAPVPAA